ncbi:MAG: hypothetical protein ACOVNR_01295 [Chitinophagaceae bacterium]
MKFIYLVLGITCSIINYCYAQEKVTNAKWQYKSLYSVGVLAGEAGFYIQPHTVHGLSKNNWLLDIGASYDGYVFNALPVFFHARKYSAAKTKWQPFGYAEVGAVIPLANETLPKTYFNGMKAYEQKTGFIGELGFGISKPFKQNKRLDFSFGYSHKLYRYDRFAPPFWIWPPQLSEYPTQSEHNFRRWCLKTSISF